MVAEIQEIILVVFSETIAVSGSFYYSYSVAVTTMVVDVAVPFLVVTATIIAVNGLFGLSLFPASAVAVITVVAVAAKLGDVGGVTTAHSILSRGILHNFSHIVNKGGAYGRY